jgi:hypothetical protein
MTHVPEISDETVVAQTKKDWAAWFFTLDTSGAARLDHAAIVRLLAERHGVESGWAQTISVEYERARGLRAPHQPASAAFSAFLTIRTAVALSARDGRTVEAQESRGHGERQGADVHQAREGDHGRRAKRR